MQRRDGAGVFFLCVILSEERGDESKDPYF
jgi:hypothetical protein